MMLCNWFKRTIALLIIALLFFFPVGNAIKHSL